MAYCDHCETESGKNVRRCLKCGRDVCPYCQEDEDCNLPPLDSSEEDNNGTT